MDVVLFFAANFCKILEKSIWDHYGLYPVLLYFSLEKNWDHQQKGC